MFGVIPIVPSLLLSLILACQGVTVRCCIASHLQLDHTSPREHSIPCPCMPIHSLSGLGREESESPRWEGEESLPVSHYCAIVLVVYSKKLSCVNRHKLLDMLFRGLCSKPHSGREKPLCMQVFGAQLFDTNNTITTYNCHCYMLLVMTKILLATNKDGHSSDQWRVMSWYM